MDYFPRFFPANFCCFVINFCCGLCNSSGFCCVFCCEIGHKTFSSSACVFLVAVCWAPFKVVHVRTIFKQDSSDAGNAISIQVSKMNRWHFDRQDKKNMSVKSLCLLCLKLWLYGRSLTSFSQQKLMSNIHDTWRPRFRCCYFNKITKVCPILLIVDL